MKNLFFLTILLLTNWASSQISYEISREDGEYQKFDRNHQITFTISVNNIADEESYFLIETTRNLDNGLTEEVIYYIYDVEGEDEGDDAFLYIDAYDGAYGVTLGIFFFYEGEELGVDFIYDDDILVTKIGNILLNFD